MDCEKNVKNLHLWSFWAKMANFGQFLAKMGKMGIFLKKALGTFLPRLQALNNCKVSEKVMNGFQATAWRTKRTDGCKSLRSTDFVARPKTSCLAAGLSTSDHFSVFLAKKLSKLQTSIFGHFGHKLSKICQNPQKWEVFCILFCNPFIRIC